MELNDELALAQLSMTWDNPRALWSSQSWIEDMWHIYVLVYTYDYNDKYGVHRDFPVRFVVCINGHAAMDGIIN